MLWTFLAFVFPSDKVGNLMVEPGHIFYVSQVSLGDWQSHYPFPIMILHNQSIHCILLKAGGKKGNLLHENDQATRGMIQMK